MAIPRWLPPSLVFACCHALIGCGDGDNTETETDAPSAFALEFVATAAGEDIGCTDVVEGFGPDGSSSIGVSDLRFYVSNLRFADEHGESVALTLDEDEFQYRSDAGAVVLIDLTSNTEGSCADFAISLAEGTERTHAALTGTTLVSRVRSLSFDVGVPQKLMGEIIAEHSPEGAPSPLDEMYWSWAGGYRHFVFNFAIESGGETGEGYLHLGSRGCGPADGLALEDRERCDFVNTPAVALSDFDLENDRVAVDLSSLLAGIDFVSPIYDAATFEVIGEGPGVECHSSPQQPDCAPTFANLGVAIQTGDADAESDTVFVRH